MGKISSTALQLWPASTPELGAKLASADVVFTQPDILPPVVPTITSPSSKIKWLHSAWAGMTVVFSAWSRDYCPSTTGMESLTSIPKLSFPVTRHVGSFGQQMGEYVVGQIIARERGFQQLSAAQEARKWLGGWMDDPLHSQLASPSVPPQGQDCKIAPATL